MRAHLAMLAAAGAIISGCAAAREEMPERYPVAMMSASDVVRTKRCAPPLGCKRPRSGPQRAAASEPAVARPSSSARETRSI